MIGLRLNAIVSVLSISGLGVGVAYGSSILMGEGHKTIKKSWKIESRECLTWTYDFLSSTLIVCRPKDQGSQVPSFYLWWIKGMNFETGLGQYFFPIETINVSQNKIKFTFKNDSKDLSGDKELHMKNSYTQRPKIETLNGQKLEEICKLETNNNLNCTGTGGAQAYYYKLTQPQNFNIVSGNY
ncbi:hypothetical protein OVS_04235 [Mycoplasma ovis str. Michigan]|uniref:Uncharacterized protein n=1 Tax=Mycoplasma ovis str. Michigan TaxID=1415773 RepID=A0ABM5P282_9MOLU|nr:hypothetical protein [Mycoplasma ovis]AHC40574.1 hypothetical protein OVS_04235 [Mycoplasma ovis str. Michigan]